MAEKYIKASECEKYFYEHLDDNGMIGAMNAIAEMPAADVQPVKHGRWVAQLNGHVVCTFCGKEQKFSSDFCKHCGADMQGADVQPVKLGQWVFTEKLIQGSPYGSYKCSECMYHVPHKDNFCPNCGADMRDTETMKG